MKATLTRAIGGLFFVFFILTMFSLEAGFAAEKEDKPVISITPRLWYTNMNINEYNPSTTYQETWKHLNIPIYGVTIGFAPKSLKSTEFLLTVLHGTGNTQGTVVNANGNTTPATVDLKRHDLELLVRHKIAESGVYLFYGPRYFLIEFDATFKPGWTHDATNTNRLRFEETIILAQLGLGMSVPITKDEKHILFGNVIGGIGRIEDKVENRATSDSPDKKFTAYSVDVQMGYQLALTKGFSAHTRYRAVTIYDNSGDATVIHGPEIGLKFSF